MLPPFVGYRLPGGPADTGGGGLGLRIKGAFARKRHDHFVDADRPITLETEQVAFETCRTRHRDRAHDALNP